MTPLLRLDGVAARYGSIEVLRGVSLGVAQGGITTLLGANGAGKTTTLRAICSLMVQTSGEIHFAGATTHGTSVLAVRPERIQILRADERTEHPNILPGEARVVTFLGPTTESLIHLNSGETVTVHAPTAQLNGGAPRPGEAIRLAWPPEASLVLEASDHQQTPLQDGGS